MDLEPSEKKYEPASIEAGEREEEEELLNEEQINHQTQNTQQSQENMRLDQTQAESFIDADSGSQGIYR